MQYLNTKKPSRKEIEDNFDFFDDIERGHGICIIVYKDNLPDEIFFAGYSFD